MEYLLGCLITLLTIYIVVRLIRNPANSFQKTKPVFGQSRKYELIKKYYIEKAIKNMNKQSFNDASNQYVKIVYVENKAYWVENNLLYQASHFNGKILLETKKTVDTMGMDRVELNRIIFIVDKLAEGKNNDSGNSGHKEF